MSPRDDSGELQRAVALDPTDPAPAPALRPPSGVGRLILVRHGQASAHADDYDQLSALGFRQAVELGRHWAAVGLRPDRVFLGPLRRHRQTLERVGAVMAEQGSALPAPQVLAELDEHAGMAVVDQALPHLARRDPEIARWTSTTPADPNERLELYFRAFRRVVRMWVRGELPPGEPAMETWQAFRRRVEGGLRRVIDAADGASTVAVFTSGGPVAAAVAHTLELSDEKTLELSWAIQNISTTELLFSPGRLSLRTFNALPHLDAELVTYV